MTAHSEVVYVCNTRPREESPLTAPGTGGIPVEWSSATRLIPARPVPKATVNATPPPEEEPLIIRPCFEPQEDAEEIQKPAPNYGGQGESGQTPPEEPLIQGPGIFSGG